MDETHIAQLVGRAKERDPDAFDRIIDLYAHRLYGYLYRLTGARDDAEDLLQEVFLRVVRTIGTYQHDGRFEGWLFRIATNLARDRVRRVERAPRSVSLEAAGDAAGLGERVNRQHVARLTAPDDGDALVRREDVDAMQAALARLPVAEREVVMLRHFSQLSFAEIAEAMGTPLGTALARCHRGLRKLRELMTGGEEDASPARVGR